MTGAAGAASVASLVFLCSSDVAFAARIGDGAESVNVRFGQLALALVVLALLSRRRPPWPSEGLRPVLLAWLGFVAAYGLAALAAPETERTLLKLGWGIFNIGLAAPG
ncbi:MAG: hypothetical protein WD801_10830 [Gemmatimonadaceae bacterium]